MEFCIISMCCKGYTVCILEYWYHEGIAVFESICFTAILKFVSVCSVITHIFLTRQVKCSYSDMNQNGAMNIVPNSWKWPEQLVVLYWLFAEYVHSDIAALYMKERQIIEQLSYMHCADLYTWMWFYTRGGQTRLTFAHYCDRLIKFLNTCVTSRPYDLVYCGTTEKAPVQRMIKSLNG